MPWLRSGPSMSTHSVPASSMPTAGLPRARSCWPWGNVSQPKLMEHAPTFYPERWLSTGEPYEFTVRRTEKRPTELIDEFQRIVKDAKLQDILGLYRIDGGKETPAIIEWTEGRENLTREITDDDKTGEPIQTAWDSSRGDPDTMSCMIYCDQRTTRGSSVHKGIEPPHPQASSCLSCQLIEGTRSHVKN